MKHVPADATPHWCLRAGLVHWLHVTGACALYCPRAAPAMVLALGERLTAMSPMALLVAATGSIATAMGSLASPSFGG